MKNYLSIWLHSLLHNTKAIIFLRRLLRPFPKLEEEIRVVIYYLKKTTTKSSINHKHYKNRHRHPLEQHKPQLFFDVSELANRDVHTGIQRVLHALLEQLHRNPPAGYQLRVVRSDFSNGLVYARKFETDIVGSHSCTETDTPVEMSAGDIFFSADLHLQFPFSTLRNLTTHGIKVVFVVYDLFGLTLGDMLPKSYQLAFRDWFEGVSKIASLVICDSQSVADEVKVWFENHSSVRSTTLPIGYFQLGVNLEPHQTHPSNVEDCQANLASNNATPTMLMVGTLEPRKGHASALEAIERLWNEGIQINLVIVGKEGWRSHDLVRRLRRHPQRNKQLFWLEKASDALLVQLYAQSTALLAASFAEGFGLPLIEAAHYGLPIIARDIPVFHEVAGDFAFYFPNTDSIALADSLRQWLRLHAEGKAPQSKDMPYLTWAQSTQQLLKVILEDNWYTVYQPADENKTTHTEQ